MVKISILATGDAFITRPLPETGYPGFDRLQAVIRSHEVAFSNLEMTFHNAEGYANAVSGGTWAMADPARLDDMRRYGFNLFNTANNHALDYSYGGLLATARNLQERGMVFSGTGKNLAEASKPCYLQTKNARVALVSCSAGQIHSMAGPQGPELPGRPGMSLMRCEYIYHLEGEDFDRLQQLARVSGVNLRQERTVRNGYANPEPAGTLSFGGLRFVRDSRTFIESKPHAADLKRILTQVEEARRQADIVLVSIHTHDSTTVETNLPADYLKLFSRACIDAGAAAVLGHGPHELQGIEVYNGGVIFYSLGNFIFQTENVSVQPADAYLSKGMDLSTQVGQYMDDRSKNGTRGYAVQEWIWKSVMAGLTVCDGRVRQVQLYPVELGQQLPRSQKGSPVLSQDMGILDYLAGLSRPFGTAIRVEDGIGIIDLEAAK